MNQKHRRKVRRKLKLREGFKRFLVYFIAILLIFIYSVKESYSVYKSFKYKETLEYKLTSVGYNLDEAKLIESKLSDEIINNILNKEYDSNIYPLIGSKYFIESNLDEYLEYKLYHKDYSYEDVISLVNVNMNHGLYGIVFEADIEKGYEVLVNKFYYLNDDYIRNDMVSFNLQYAYSNNKAASIVVESFDKLYWDCLNDTGARLMVNGSYRSFDYQKNMYETYKRINSLRYADKMVARGGHSEHQTGLVIDVASLEHGLYDSFIESDEYKWLIDNSYKYGFIVRYPIGKEYITGVYNDAWHLRYVGVELATKIYNEGITFDEYYAYYLNR